MTSRLLEVCQHSGRVGWHSHPVLRSKAFEFGWFKREAPMQVDSTERPPSLSRKAYTAGRENLCRLILHTLLDGADGKPDMTRLY